jgi:DNA-binding NarL/FixJ family response regulator
MGGKECIQKLQEMDPNVKAVVSSGYSDDPVVANYQDYGFRGVLSKPYKINQLREILEQFIT